jgi:hypothetical protein
MDLSKIHQQALLKIFKTQEKETNKIKAKLTTLKV